MDYSGVSTGLWFLYFHRFGVGGIEKAMPCWEKGFPPQILKGHLHNIKYIKYFGCVASSWQGCHFTMGKALAMLN